MFDPGPPVEPPHATVRHLHAKDCVWRHDHEPGGPTTYQCFSRGQLGTAAEKITEGEGVRIGEGVYRFGWPVADVRAHACSCGYWAACWHLAAALLLESGLRPNPEVVEVGRRYRQARLDRCATDLERRRREQSGEFIAGEVEEYLRGQVDK